MHKLILWSLFICAGSLQAQSQPPPSASIPGQDPVSQSSFAMELMRRSAQQREQDEISQVAARRQERLARTIFCAKANRFVEIWTDFSTRLNQKQTFDVKLARKLAKAFHDLESSEGWPVPEAK